MASTYSENFARDLAAARAVVMSARPRSRMMTLFPLLRRSRWYAARLAAMPPREIPHRIAEARRRMAWRRDIAGWEAFDTISDGPLADLAPLRSRLAHGFGHGADDPATISRRLTCAGQFTFLGLDWPAIAPQSGQTLQIPSSFWFHDPATGGSWPSAEASSFDIDVRSTGAQIGDVKYVWEPNRLQMLHPLASAIAATRDQTARKTAFAIITSWAAGNPPYRGVNWVSSIELALRLVSIMLVVAAEEPSALSAAERVLIRGIVVAHGRYLAAFPSLYSSANNHRVAEGLGLFVAGLLLPDLEEARAWRDDGRAILEAESVRQILADGVGAEQSPSYQAFTMEMLVLAARLAGDLGAPLDASVAERLVRGAEYLSWLAGEDGCVPAIGDNDEGHVIAQPPDREPRYVASVIAAVAGFAERGDLAPAAHDPHLRDAIFDSPVTSLAEPTGLRISERGGMTVARETFAGRRAHLLFDHGPLGMMPLGAHGHSDALAIWLTIDGQPVFIDAGTYRYFSGGDIRTDLRESLTHNTLAIGGVSQSRASTAFGWSTIANAFLVAASHGPEWWVSGAHDGYRRRFGVRHVRQVSRTAAGYAIDDRLDGSRQPLPVTLHFLCHPEVSVAIEGGSVAISGKCGVLCRITPPKGFSAEIGQTLHSQRFGHIAPAPRLVFAGQLADDAAKTMIDIAEPPTADTAAERRMAQPAPRLADALA
jgi:uncharacterized heparinase superfamily protein